MSYREHLVLCAEMRYRDTQVGGLQGPRRSGGASSTTILGRAVLRRGLASIGVNSAHLRARRVQVLRRLPGGGSPGHDLVQPPTCFLHGFGSAVDRAGEHHEAVHLVAGVARRSRASGRVLQSWSWASRSSRIQLPGGSEPVADSRPGHPPSRFHTGAWTNGSGSTRRSPPEPSCIPGRSRRAEP
jgi:hypothetical protein